jgi:tetraacyldisaccharide 4'-kinase
VKLHPLLRAALWLASQLFGAIVRLRAWLYRNRVLTQKRLSGVVISVGNLTVGGTGKTPMVTWLAERLLVEGKRVGILTRGYRGSTGQSIPVQGSQQVPADYVPLKVFSDEVWIYWNRFELKRHEKNLLLGVGADRWRWGKRLERAGADCFLLDDGFQHLQLARDVDIVMIDSTDPFGGGQLLPAGRLREPPSALARADAVVITRAQQALEIEAEIRRYTSAPFFYAQTALTDMPQRNPAQVGAMKADPQKRKYFAFCGIGNRSAFFDDLRRWKIEVLGTAEYPDHHSYSQDDADKLQESAVAAGADALVCTEKDVANLLKVRFARMPVFYCRIVLHIADTAGFWRHITETLERKRGAGKQ